MKLIEKIDKDLIEALKAKDEIKLGTLRFLKSAIKNCAIEKREKELKDQDVIQVIRKQIKQRHDAIEAYKNADRLDLAKKEERELSILKSYMPVELKEDELKKIILQAIDEVNAATIKDMGKVMSVLMPKIAGRADGKTLSGLVMMELKRLESK